MSNECFTRDGAAPPCAGNRATVTGTAVPVEAVRWAVDRFSLSGRSALVTGSVRGLGLEMARGLASEGARVVLNGRDPVALGTR